MRGWVVGILLVLLLPRWGAAQRLSGTASDGVGVVRVTWTCPTCTPQSATATCLTCGPTATQVVWQVPPIGLARGANVVTVTAHTPDGRTSMDQLTVTYTPPPVVLPPPSPILRLVDCTTHMGLPHVRCVVLWDAPLEAGVTWHLEACVDLPTGCPWQVQQHFDAATRQATLDGLPRQQPLCWRFVPQGSLAGTPASNTVCR